MKNELISVIVPIYNTEKFLTECVNSILDQTYKNLEVILVDNGSTDKTSQICDDFKEKDERVKVIHKTHGSISSGRNEGLRNSTGCLLTFVDSDDVLAPDMVQKLYNTLINTNSELSVCKAKRLYIDCVEEMPQTDTITIYDSQAAIQAWICKREFGNEVWAKLYRREAVEGELFPDMQCEDMIYLFKALQKANKISIIDSRLYMYRMHRLYREKSSFRRPVESEKPMVYADMMEKVKNQYPDIYNEFFAACCEDELSNIMKIYAANKQQSQKEYIENITAFFGNIYKDIISNKHIKKRSKKFIRLFYNNRRLFGLLFYIRNKVKR